MKHERNFKFATRLFFAVLFLVANVIAAGYDGEPMELSQPDGSEVTVHLFGSSYFATAESPDGYTLIRDTDGWLCYAKLSADESEYVSTGIRYTGKSIAPPVRRGLRISEKSMREKRKKSMEAVGYNEEEVLRNFNEKVERHERRMRREQSESGIQSAPPEDEDEFQHAPRTVTGMALFISFSDYPAPTGAILDNWNAKAPAAVLLRNLAVVWHPAVVALQ